jgi:hypothetical protein
MSARRSSLRTDVIIHRSLPHHGCNGDSSPRCRNTSQLCGGSRPCSVGNSGTRNGSYSGRIGFPPTANMLNLLTKPILPLATIHFSDIPHSPFKASRALQDPNVQRGPTIVRLAAIIAHRARRLTIFLDRRCALRGSAREQSFTRQSARSCTRPSVSRENILGTLVEVPPNECTVGLSCGHQAGATPRRHCVVEDFSFLVHAPRMPTP